MNPLMADCLEYIPTTYNNIEGTQELIPNVLQLFNGSTNSLIYILKPNRKQSTEMIFTITPIEAKSPVGGG